MITFQCRVGNLENVEDIEEKLDGIDGLLIPGGFGDRGTEGKINAANFARTRGIPYFGICLGMQIATIEFARNVAKLVRLCSPQHILSQDKK